MSGDEAYNTHTLLADDTVTFASIPMRRTRTVAMIKHHAFLHRLDIETRIAEAGFEIVKERQMEFDVETDPDTLVDLFGVDAYSFSEGPVRVLILERENAIEEWKALMGDADPAVAREVAPNSIRALYGLSASQNSVMGSVDGDAAEMQIASLFASSPPFPVSDLPEVNGVTYSMDSMRSAASDLLSALASTSGTDEQYTTNGSSSQVSGTAKGLGISFKARPVPATNSVPSIKPRMSRAAALRTGALQLDEEKPKTGPRVPVSKDRLAQTFADVPGHGFRSQKIQVASTAAPAIAPRMTKAAALRLGLPMEKRGPPRPRASTAPSTGMNGGEKASEAKKDTFDGVPGHKRRESIAVASTKAPSVAPRLNRAASLRSQKSEGGPPSSFTMRPSAAPPLSRSNSRSSMGGGTARPSFSRPSSAAASKPPPSAFTHRAVASIATAPSGGLSVPTISRSASNNSLNSQTASERSPLEPKPRVVPRPSSINAPTMAPRQNKAASLRAAKMAQAQAGAVKTPARKPLSTF